MKLFASGAEPCLCVEEGSAGGAVWLRAVVQQLVKLEYASHATCGLLRLSVAALAIAAAAAR